MSSLVSRTIWCFVISVSGMTALAQSAQEAPAKISELEGEVQKYLQEQKPELAIPLLRQIITLDSGNLSAHANLGVLLYFQGKYPEAIPEMRTAVQMQPDLWKIEALLGIAEKRTGDSADAQNDLEQAFQKLEDKGIQVQAGLELIELDSASGQLGKAAAVAEVLESISPEDQQILLAAYQISLQITDRSLLSMALIAPDSAEMHMMMADQFVRQGDRDGAIAQFRVAIGLNPHLPGVHFELAEQLRTAEDPAMKSQAVEEYKAALAINDLDEKAWRGLGEITAEKGNYSVAKDDYTKALALQPRDSDAETDLAITLISLNETDKALQLLESAVKDDPTNALAHFRLSTLYRQAGRTADSEHEMEVFRHYKSMKDKLGTTFKQMRLQGNSK